jgi:hypothetical protein
MRLLISVSFVMAIAAAPAMAEGTFGSGKGPWYRPRAATPSLADAYKPAPPPKAASPATPLQSGGFKPYEPWKGGSVYDPPKANPTTDPCKTSVYSNACQRSRP